MFSKLFSYNEDYRLTLVIFLASVFHVKFYVSCLTIFVLIATSGIKAKHGIRKRSSSSIYLQVHRTVVCICIYYLVLLRWSQFPCHHQSVMISIHLQYMLSISRVDFGHQILLGVVWSIYKEEKFMSVLPLFTEVVCDVAFTCNHQVYMDWGSNQVYFALLLLLFSSGEKLDFKLFAMHTQVDYHKVLSSLLNIHKLYTRPHVFFLELHQNSRRLFFLFWLL